MTYPGPTDTLQLFKRTCVNLDTTGEEFSKVVGELLGGETNLGWLKTRAQGPVYLPAGRCVYMEAGFLENS